MDEEEGFQNKFIMSTLSKKCKHPLLHSLANLPTSCLLTCDAMVTAWKHAIILMSN